MRISFSRWTILKLKKIRNSEYARASIDLYLPKDLVNKKAYVEGTLYIDEEPKRESQSQECKCPDLSEIEPLLIDILTVFENLNVKDRRLSRKIAELRSRIEEALRRLR